MPTKKVPIKRGVAMEGCCPPSILSVRLDLAENIRDMLTYAGSD